MKMTLALGLIAVAYLAVGSAAADTTISTPRGTYYVLHQELIDVGVGQESNGCDGFQRTADAEECAPGTPADTTMFEYDP